MFLLCAVGCKLQIYEDLNFHSLLFCPLLLPLLCLKISCGKCCGFLYKILLMITELRLLSRIGNIDDQRNVKCSTDCCSSQHNGCAELGWGVTQT